MTQRPLCTYDGLEWRFKAAFHPPNQCQLCKDVLQLHVDGEELISSNQGLHEHEQRREYLSPAVQPFDEGLVLLRVAKAATKVPALGIVVQPIQND